MKGVSVIICCYNSSSRLPRTLEHLATQEVDFPVELILIDNASTDNTAYTARQIWTNLNSPFPMEICREPQPGLMNARSLGIRMAQHEVIVFCDDDNWLANAYLSSAFYFLKNKPKYGAVGGCGSVISDVDIPFWFKDVSFYYACFAQENPTVLYGAGLTVRTSILKRVLSSNFKTRLTGRSQTLLVGGDDHELSYLIRWQGYELGYSPDMTFKHYMPASRLNLTYLYRLGKGSGYSAPFLWPYETLANLHVYAVYKFARLLAGFLKIALNYIIRPRSLWIRLRLHTIVSKNVAVSYLNNQKSLSSIQAINKKYRAVFSRREQ